MEYLATSLMYVNDVRHTIDSSFVSTVFTGNVFVL